MSQEQDLALIAENGQRLSPRCIAILRQMAHHQHDYDGEIVYEKGVAYLGDTRIAARSLFAMLRACALHGEGEPGGLERYTINETGRRLLRTFS